MAALVTSVVAAIGTPIIGQFVAFMVVSAARHRESMMDGQVSSPACSTSAVRPARISTSSELTTVSAVAHVKPSPERFKNY